jgi:hypothetical protein|tara:strand:- start:773 stop:943 length:171 start_codon:yes stop_codon:yes gene_type:complete
MNKDKTGKYNGIYKSPIEIPPPATAGYPNNIPSTQTLKTRGTGAATKGTNSSKRLA